MAKLVNNAVVVNARNRIRERDSRLYTYPTIKRTGDPDRKGDFAVRFDDTATIIFDPAPENLHLPTGLRFESIHLTADSEVSDKTDGDTGGGVALNAGGIILSGNVRPGVGDAIVSDIPGNRLLNRRKVSPGDRLQTIKGYEENITPFVEAHLHEIESSSWDDPFWRTGSKHTDVGLGFTQPLAAKTKLEFVLGTSANTQFGYPFTPTVGNQQTAFYPMVYYNFDDQKWDRIGTGSVGSGFGKLGTAESIQADAQTWVEQTTMGFTRGTELSITAAQIQCHPCSNFGFPIHPKFHATASQLLDMSQHINQPFLLEKIVYEGSLLYTLGTSGSFDQIKEHTPAGLLNTSYYASVLTFFILNQRPFYSASVIHSMPRAGDDATITNITITSSLPADLVISAGGPTERVTSARDLVTYMQLLSFDDDEGTNSIPPITLDDLVSGGLGRELNIDLRAEHSGSTRGSFFSARRIVMSGTVKQASRADSTYGWKLDTTTDLLEPIITGTNIPGGRTGIELKYSGRDFGAVQPATKPIERRFLDLSTDAFTATEQKPANSPYLLFPEDKLVFGWQMPVPRNIAAVVSNSNGYFAGPQVNLEPLVGEPFENSIKITFYGSLVRDGQEFHDTRNQPLASNAIHEAIHYDNPVLDQYDTEPFAVLTGSYVDDFVTGSMLPRANSAGALVFSFGDTADSQLTIGPRGVFTSNFSSGSRGYSRQVRQSIRKKPIHTLQQKFRNVKHVSEGERYYDSVLPRAIEAYLKDGSVVNVLVDGDDFFGPGTQIPPVYGILSYDRRLVGAATGTVNYDWTPSFIFDRYSSLSRFLDPLPATPLAHDGDAVETIRNFLISSGRPAPTDSNTFATMGDAIMGFENYALFPLKEDLIKWLYGFGDVTGQSGLGVHGSALVHNRPEFNLLSQTQSPAYHGPVIRGWRYGVMSGLEHNSSVVYRRDRYGQFRDMLEQRQNTRFYDTLGRLSIDATEQRNPGVRSPAVSVRFINPNGQSVEGNRTFSSNLDIFATSSLPYFDLEVKNREEPLDLTLIDSVDFTV